MIGGGSSFTLLNNESMICLASSLNLLSLICMSGGISASGIVSPQPSIVLWSMIEEWQPSSHEPMEKHCDPELSSSPVRN
jgi:hypothetical protein